MTATALKAILDKINPDGQENFPVVYHSFKSSGLDPAPLPFIVYFLEKSDNIGASNQVYIKQDNFIVELYTEFKDEDSERLLEDLFDSNKIFYNKTETYINTETMYQIRYKI